MFGAVAELQATGAMGLLGFIVVEHFWYKNACWDAARRAKNKEDKVMACGKRGALC